MEKDNLASSSLKRMLAYSSIGQIGYVIIAEIIKERDHAHAKYKVTKKENARLNEKLAKLSSSIPNVNDACATNSTSCEASILKENVELRAQLELLTRKYGKLEESHEKLSSSNDDLLASYVSLKLTHEAITTKVTSCESHVDNGTTLSKNAILPANQPNFAVQA